MKTHHQTVAFLNIFPFYKDINSTTLKKSNEIQFFIYANAHLEPFSYQIFSELLKLRENGIFLSRYVRSTYKLRGNEGEI